LLPDFGIYLVGFDSVTLNKVRSNLRKETVCGRGIFSSWSVCCICL